MPMMYDFTRAFQDGATCTAGKHTFTMQTMRIGDLTVQTGRIVACDPFVESEASPLVAAIPQGEYPVFLSRATIEPNHQRNACAMLKITDALPVRWEMAMRPEQNLANLYFVDAGVGCFMDVAAAQVLDARLRADEMYHENLIDALNANQYVYANFALTPEIDANCIMFSSGWGDGIYASFWGYDVDDHIACLVTDFQVIDARVNDRPASDGDDG